MKPAPFEYVRPADIDEACALLAADDSARLIAGGQTLVPLMAMRLARPTRLIDIARIPALSFVREEGDAVVIGAATRQCVVENDPLVRVKLPLLARDLRILVREHIKSGDSDAQVLEFLTSRYGEFVLLRPSLSRHNVFLWLAPAVLLIAGAAGLILASRRRRVVPVDTTPLSADEERRIQDVINR